MKQYFLLLTLFLGTFNAISQDILLINDNDNITQNTDTFLLALQNSNYQNYTYYNLVDSTSMPSYDYLSGFDILIYYASTDGIGLGIWDNGVNGNAALQGFLIDGGRAWFIGSDILFAGGYMAPTTFNTSDFAYEYLGLESYNNQSYGNDGGLGVSEIFRHSSAPTTFPTSLEWVFSTAWWVDDITSRVGATDLYEMGPSGYALHEAVCMTHYTDAVTNAMTSFFDPALILGTTTDRVDFINSSIDYLWSFDLGFSDEPESVSTIKIYPSQAENYINIETTLTTNLSFEVYSMLGSVVISGELNNSTTVINVQDLEAGMYFFRTGNEVQKFMVK